MEIKFKKLKSNTIIKIALIVTLITGVFSGVLYTYYPIALFIPFLFIGLIFSTHFELDKEENPNDKK